MRNFDNLNSSISQFARKLNLKLVKEKIEIIESWNEIVGEEFSKRAEADRFNDGVLYIAVSNSAWLNEISFLKDDVIDKYKKKFGRKIVREIKCFIRRENNDYNPKIKKNKINDTEKTLTINKRISDEEKKEIEDKSSVIEDDRLRDAMQRFLEKGRSKELSMLSQGWKKCQMCSAPHQGKEDICISCKSK